MVFGRVITAMVTPFNEELAVDYQGAAELARYLAANGSDGIVVAGTTGESPTLSTAEKVKLFAAVVEAVGDRVAVIAGTGSNNTAASIALTREAEAVGVHGVLLVGPYYNKPPQPGYYEHFAAIARATSLPVMLYNIPGRTAANILPATVARLAAIDNIVAIKEAAGCLDQVSELVRILPPGFKVYSGDDSLTLPLLSVGGFGVVSVASHFVGQDLQAMIAHFLAGNVKEATAIHLRLYPLLKGLFIVTNPIPVKAALNLRGLPAGGLRLPLLPAAEKEVASIRQLLVDYRLLPA
ncbi:MAG: 4-hydroxy-tetrahydrodipicolinate synthase [Heliobacteriaceae bacterium]|nr:4-hydroxy-tetrahydrodipicolinate synthase [Heliobacteriaceae bacterium]MDD4586955.1 4-hydroxy-tetrahydrodipicolinate synthase [Heliobacteriaceae bacterium]